MPSRTASAIYSLRPLVVLCSSLSLFGVESVAQNIAPSLTQPIPDQILARGAAPLEIELSDHFVDPDVTSPAVRFAVRIGDLHRTIDLALFHAHTPITATNFINHINAGYYSANFIHRSVPGFIIQGGGFRFIDDSELGYVSTFPPIVNEPGISNTRGTVAMAKLGGDPNSATSQWFINLADNSSNLDEQNGGFTVFARVVGNGMVVADEIAAVTVYDATGALGHSAFAELPLTQPSVARQYFIETSASLIDPLRFSVASSDPGLVLAEIDHGRLRLTPYAFSTGLVTVTLTATDLDGATLQTTFDVQVRETYTGWIASHPFANGLDAAPAADPDNDGLPNLLEFALGRDPLLATPSVPPLAVSSSGVASFTFARFALGDVKLETSIDLIHWRTVWSTKDGLDHPAVKDHQIESNRISVSLRSEDELPPSGRRFWRLRASE